MRSRRPPRRTGMRTFTLLALFGVSLAACQAEPTTASSPSAVVPVAPPALASASVAAPASVAPRPSAAPPRATLASVRRATDRACQPRAVATNNIEMKAQASESASCVSAAMVRELDRVLVPLKASAPARFRLLMDQQAAFNRFERALAFLAEETMWVDFAEGTRSDGTARGTGTIGCTTSAALERTVYASALGSGDVAALAAEIRAAEKRGAKTKLALAQIEAASARRALVPAKPAEPGMEPIAPEGWKRLFQDAQTASDLAQTLARSICDDVAGLEGALGGAKACRESVAHYELAACDIEPIVGEEPKRLRLVSTLQPRKPCPRRAA